MAAPPSAERTVRKAGPSVLVVSPTWLGDSVMAGPAVQALKSSRPSSRLTVLARPALVPLWSGFPGVDEVLPYEKNGLKRITGFFSALALLKQRRFDEAAVLPPSFSSALLVFLAGIPVRAGYRTDGRGFLLNRPVENPSPRTRHAVWEHLDLVHQGLGVPIPKGPVALTAVSSPEAKSALDKILETEGFPVEKGIIALGPGATYGPAKRWPLEYWRLLMEGVLRERTEALVLVGGAEEEAYLRSLLEGWGTAEAARVRDLAGKTLPDVLAELFRVSRIFITNDTGPMHLAAAAGTSVLAVFGSTSPAWTRPLGKGHVVLRHPLPCSPCYRRECGIGYPCLKDLKPDTVLKASLDVLRGQVRIQPEDYGS